MRDLVPFLAEQFPFGSLGKGVFRAGAAARLTGCSPSRPPAGAEAHQSAPGAGPGSDRGACTEV